MDPVQEGPATVGYLIIEKSPLVKPARESRKWTHITNPMSLNEAKLIDPLSDRRWDPFVGSHPYGTIYQLSCWMKVIALTYRHARPLCSVLEDQNGDIRAAIPWFIVKSTLTRTRIVSLPFSGYCDPLVDSASDFAVLLDSIIDTLDDLSGSYYELRTFRKPDSIKDGRLKVHNYHKTHVLDLKDGFDRIKSAFPRDIIYSQKKALKLGVTIRQIESEQDLKEFYFINAGTRKRQGLPVQPYKFFKNMWRILYPQGYLDGFLAKWNKKTIAGMIIFKFRNTVFDAFRASISKYLAVRPNHLLLWTAIEMACTKGYDYFDFGKTTSENQGLLNFKSRWGGDMYDVPYLYYPEIKGMMSLKQESLRIRLARFFGSHIPLPVARIIGRIAYRHIG